MTVPGGATLLWRIAGADRPPARRDDHRAPAASTSRATSSSTRAARSSGRSRSPAPTSRGQLDASGPGTAAYLIVNSVNLIGDVNADADIQVGTSTGSGALYVNNRDVTNRGSIQVGPEPSIYPAALSDEG